MSYNFSYKDWRDDPRNSVSLLIKAEQINLDSDTDEIGLVVWRGNRVSLNVSRSHPESPETMELTMGEFQAILKAGAHMNNLLELFPAQEVGRAL